MPTPDEIFVRLLDESMDVWRPVRAEPWEFEPGDEVVCELIDASEGRILAAVRPGVEAAAAQAPHVCDGMALAVDDSRVPLVYLAKFREYGLVASAASLQIIEYCPWCGSALPPSLRDEFFDRLDA